MPTIQTLFHCGSVGRELQRLHRDGDLQPRLLVGLCGLMMTLSAAALFWLYLEGLRYHARKSTEMAIGLLEIRSRYHQIIASDWARRSHTLDSLCLLYTSDAADE